MRISKMLLAATVSACLTSPVVMAETGQFNFNGKITASPCSISGNDLDQDVPLGVVTTADLANDTGNDGTSIPRNFSMKLEKCIVTTGSGDSLTVTLIPGSTSQYGDEFGLNEPDRGAFLVVKKDGKKILPNVATDVQKLVSGNNMLNFTAYIQGAGGTNKAVEGDFTASTTVKLDYK